MKGKSSLFGSRGINIAAGNISFMPKQVKNLNLENILQIDQILIPMECLM